MSPSQRSSYNGDAVWQLQNQDRRTNGRDSYIIAHNVELQVSHSVRAEVSEKSILCGKTTLDRSDTKTVMQVERGNDTGSGSMPGSCAYACGDTSEVQCFAIHGISEREKQPDDIREMGKHEVQVSEQRILVQRILCRYGRKEHEEDKRIYSTSA